MMRARGHHPGSEAAGRASGTRGGRLRSRALSDCSCFSPRDTQPGEPRAPARRADDATDSHPHSMLSRCIRAPSHCHCVHFPCTLSHFCDRASVRYLDSSLASHAYALPDLRFNLPCRSWSMRLGGEQGV